jgi:hypothetical protein
MICSTINNFWHGLLTSLNFSLLAARIAADFVCTHTHHTNQAFCLVMKKLQCLQPLTENSKYEAYIKSQACAVSQG